MMVFETYAKQIKNEMKYIQKLVINKKKEDFFNNAQLAQKLFTHFLYLCQFAHKFHNALPEIADHYPEVPWRMYSKHHLLQSQKHLPFKTHFALFYNQLWKMISELPQNLRPALDIMQNNHAFLQF